MRNVCAGILKDGILRAAGVILMWLVVGLVVGIVLGLILGVFIGFSLYKRAGAWD